MEIINKLNYIENKINEWLENSSKNSIILEMVRRKRYAVLLRVVIIILGSLITVILGTSNSVNANIVVIIISGLITVLSALDVLFNNHAKSIQLYQLVTNLHILQSDIEYYKVGKNNNEIEKNKVQEFYERYNLIIDNHFKVRHETIKSSFETNKLSENDKEKN